MKKAVRKKNKKVCVSLTWLLLKRVQRTWVYPSSSVSHKMCPLVSFFVIDIATHTTNNTKIISSCTQTTQLYR